MSRRYDPNAPNPWFPRHRHHGVPLGGAAADGETLGPELLWAGFQAEAEDALKCDGR